MTNLNSQNRDTDKEARIARAASLRLQIEEIKRGNVTGNSRKPSPRELINEKMRERYRQQKCEEEE